MSFRREGSLIKKKQEQWAKEREEEQNSVWFPFGAPGGGSPNRKYDSIDYNKKETKESSARRGSLDSSSSFSKPRVVDSTDLNQNYCSAMGVEADQIQMENGEGVRIGMTSSGSEQLTDSMTAASQPRPMHRSVSLASQLGVEHGSPASGYGQVPMRWGVPIPVPVNMLPPGTVPIPVKDLSRSIAEGVQLCPFTMAEQMNSGWIPGYSYMYQKGNHMYLSSAPSTSALTDDERNAPTMHPVDVPKMYPTELSMHYGSCQERGHTSDSQIDNQARAEENDIGTGDTSCSAHIESAARHKEMSTSSNWDLEISRIDAELEARKNFEKNQHEDEERLRLEKQHESTRESILSALEKAQKEAEQRRKARVYRHVLEGQSDKVHEIFGDDAPVEKILEEIRLVERHKKLEREEIDRHAPKPKTPKATHDVTVKPRSQSMSRADEMNSPGLQRSAAERKVSKQTASVRPYIAPSIEQMNSTTDLKEGKDGGPRFVRGATGRMSLRGTRKEDPEKENIRRNRNRSVERSDLQKSNDTDNDMKTDRCSRIPIPAPRSVTHSVNRVQTAEGSDQMTKTIADRSSARAQVVRALAQLQQKNNSMEILQLINRLPEELPKSRTESPVSIIDQNPLFSPIVTRSRRMRAPVDSPVNAMNAGDTENEQSSDSPDSLPNSPTMQSPVPSIVLDRVGGCDKLNIGGDTPLRSYRSSSSMGSPGYNGRQSPLAASIYARKLAEKGCDHHHEDVMSPEIRRKAEANLSRSPSVASLRGSVRDLRGSFANLAVNPEDSPNLSKYRSMNSSYRSFNAKRTSERQRETLDRIARIRQELHSKENFVEKSAMSRQGSALISRSPQSVI